MSARQAAARDLVRLLAAEFTVRHAVGLAGMVVPTAGVAVQRALLLWGVFVAIVCVRLLAHTPGRHTLASLSVILGIAASVILRLPPEATAYEAVPTGLLTWARLTIPIAGISLFLRLMPECLAYAEKAVAKHRAIVTLLLASSTIFLVGLRALTGSAWAWSPQEPVPYLLVGALGASGALTIAHVALISGFAVLALKRSSYVALPVLWSISPKGVSVRRTVDVTKAAAALLLGTILVLAAARTDVRDVISSRLDAGIEQVSDHLAGESRTDTSFGARAAENRAALAGWRDGPLALLFGLPLQDFEAGGRQTLAVHNSFIGILTLGGTAYATAFVAYAVSRRRVLKVPFTKRGQRWYRAAGLAVLIEALAGSALLTLSFPAAIALMIARRQRAGAAYGAGYRTNHRADV